MTSEMRMKANELLAESEALQTRLSALTDRLELFTQELQAQLDLQSGGDDGAAHH